MQTRREFLIASTQALVAATALVRPATRGTALAEWRNRQPEMAYRQLGQTGFMVSEVVMGGNTIAPDNYEHVLYALDGGLNYLDTAPAYGQGRSEEGYARVIRARGREKFFLTSKVSLWDINRNRLFQEIFESLPQSDQNRLRRRAETEIERRGADRPEYFVDYFSSQRRELDEAALSNVMEEEFGRKIDRKKNYKQVVLDSVDQSLSRLGTDYLDCILCPHGASSSYELLHFPEIFEAFEVLKKAGKARYLGVSAHTDPAGVLEAAVDAGQYAMAMIAYNIVNHDYVDSALKQAREAGVGVIAMKVARPVQRRPEQPGNPEWVRRVEAEVPGTLKVPQKAYLWALKNPNLSAVISELVHLDLVHDNLPLAGQG